ncbi:hypothetical protein GCM10027610_136380 [Dactylosporangium cerinum]
MSETVAEQTTVVPSQKTPDEPSAEHDALVVPSEKPLPEDRYLNRELSWLDFNARVLTLAEDPATPLLERAKFLAIFASNLDEFYMVRVAGLKRRLQTGIPVRRPGFLPPTEQLEQIAERTTALVARQSRVFAEEIAPAMAEEHIHIVRWSELDPAERERMRTAFREQIFPVLTPSRSTRRTRSPTSPACRSTWRSWSVSATAARSCSPGSRCPTTCRASTRWTAPPGTVCARCGSCRWRS